jgi:predicted DNA-binding transcriptional regulator AlpA
MMMTAADEMLNAHQVAKLLDVAVGTVYTMRHCGRGPASYRRGKRLVYSRSDVDAFLARERETTLRGQHQLAPLPGATQHCAWGQ